MNSTTVKCDPD